MGNQINKELIKLLAVGLISLAGSGVISPVTAQENSDSQLHHSQTASDTLPLYGVGFLSILSLSGLAVWLRKNHSFKSGLSSPTSPSVPKNTNTQAKNSQLDGSTAQFVSISSQAQSIQINSLADSRIQQQYFYLDKY